jgi:hypothetical protein
MLGKTSFDEVLVPGSANWGAMPAKRMVCFLNIFTTTTTVIPNRILGPQSKLSSCCRLQLKPKRNAEN